MSTVVVGVDGSKGSIEALRVAIDEARLHNAQVKVVNAWHVPAIVYEATWGPAPIDRRSYAKKAQDVLDKSLDEAGAAESGVEVTTVVREGQAGDAICEEAKGAELPVVGSRGFGDLRGLLLVSVSQHCAHHAPCPVLIVPDRRMTEAIEDLQHQGVLAKGGQPPVP